MIALSSFPSKLPTTFLVDAANFGILYLVEHFCGEKLDFAI